MADLGSLASSDVRESGGSMTIISYPLERVFAFTPYYVSLSSSYAAGTQYIIAFNGFTIKRYLDVNSNDKIPISGMLQSFFANTEFGDVGTFSSNLNSASKLFLQNRDIIITIGVDTFTLTFDIIWGAIQPAVREKSVVPLYMFAGLPLTITQNIGDKTVFASTTKTGFGKEVLLSGIAQASGTALVQNTAGSETYKTYNVKYNSCVPENSIYLRWVDVEGEYKYYLLNIAERINTAEFTTYFNRYPSYLNPTPGTLPSLVKNRIAYTEKKNNNRIIAGVMAADDDLTAHLESLNGSLLQWVYSKEGSAVTWTECVVLGMSIGRKTREGNRQIDFEIQLPELYNQRL